MQLSRRANLPAVRGPVQLGVFCRENIADCCLAVLCLAAGGSSFLGGEEGRVVSQIAIALPEEVTD